MMRTKSESDMASLDPASPQRWPTKRAAYYVQSPSHAGEEGEKSSPSPPSAVSSIQPTPVFNSPTESPSHPVVATAGHSRTSSANWRSKRLPSVNGNDDKECHVIHEEPPYDFDESYYYNRHRGISTRTCQLLIGLFSFVIIFTLFCLILWAASRPYGPRVTLISMTMHNLNFGAGTDSTGVPTKLATVNCSVRMNVYNPATFFGIHVTSSPINLMYSEIAIATGQVEKYYQPRKSRRMVIVDLQGTKVAMYGAGAALGSANSEKGIDVPLRLVFEVRAKGHVVGKLVKSTHRRGVTCNIDTHSRLHKPIRFMNDSCLFR